MGHYDKHPAYRNQAYVVAKKFKFGRDRTSVPNIEVEVSRGVPWFGATTLASNDLGVNIAGVLFEWITDDVFGLGLDESRLDETSWNAVKTAIDAFRISPLITEQTDARSVVAQLLEYADLWIRLEGGKLVLGQWDHGNIDVDALPSVDSDDLAEEPELTSQGYGDSVNQVFVVFKDRAHYFHDAVESCSDPSNFRVVGEPRPVYLQRPWLTDAALAKQYATEYLRIHVQPLLSGQLAVKLDAVLEKNLLPGTLFRLDSASYGLSIALRLMELEWPADDEGVATLTVENERALWPQLYQQPPAPKPGNFKAGARDVENVKVLELPVGLKKVLSSPIEVLQVAVLAQRPSKSIVGFNTHVSPDDDVYDQVATQSSFAVYGKVVNANYPNSTADLDTAVGVQVEIFGPDDMPVSQTDTQRDDHNWLAVWANGEIDSVGAITPLGGYVYNVKLRRALYGTSKLAHNIGGRCWFIPRSQIVPIANVNFVPGATVYFKLQTMTATQELSIEDATAFDVVIPGTSVATLLPPRFDRPGGNGDANNDITFGEDGNDFGAFFIQLEAGAPAGSVVRWNNTNTTLDFDDGLVVYGANNGKVFDNINATVTIRARVEAPDGRFSVERIVTLTRVPQVTGPPATETVAVPAFNRTSGTPGASTLYGYLTCPTAGATIKYDDNQDGTFSTYVAGATVSLPVNGHLAIKAEKSGSTSSAVSYYSNPANTTGGGGGGGGPPHGPYPPY